MLWKNKKIKIQIFKKLILKEKQKAQQNTIKNIQKEETKQLKIEAKGTGTNNNIINQIYNR